MGDEFVDNSFLHSIGSASSVLTVVCRPFGSVVMLVAEHRWAQIDSRGIQR
jgi:hypothetical protein